MDDKKPAKPTAKGTPSKATPSKASSSSKKKPAPKKPAPKRSATTKGYTKGKITSFDPATGRGAIKAGNTEVNLDVTKTKILNKTFTRLNVGREVEFAADDNDDATEIMIQKSSK